MDDANATRRSFLSKLLTGTLFAGAAGWVGSVLAYLLPPPTVRSGLGPQRVALGRADDFNPGAGKLTLVNDEPVWVVHIGNRFVALSAVCTHRGCTVNWEAKRRLFACPCHDGRFDAHGNVVSGLPRRSLTRFRAEVLDGTVYVSRGDERSA